MKFWGVWGHVANIYSQFWVIFCPKNRFFVCKMSLRVSWIDLILLLPYLGQFWSKLGTFYSAKTLNSQRSRWASFRPKTKSFRTFFFWPPDLHDFGPVPTLTKFFENFCSPFWVEKWLKMLSSISGFSQYIFFFENKSQFPDQFLITEEKTPEKYPPPFVVNHMVDYKVGGG